MLKEGYNQTLDELANKYGKTVVQIALNYLIAQDKVVTIPKASSKEHIDEILGSIGWELTKEDLELLRSSVI